MLIGDVCVCLPDCIEGVVHESSKHMHGWNHIAIELFDSRSLVLIHFDMKRVAIGGV